MNEGNSFVRRLVGSQPSAPTAAQHGTRFTKTGGPNSLHRKCSRLTKPLICSITGSNADLPAAMRDCYGILDDDVLDHWGFDAVARTIVGPYLIIEDLARQWKEASLSNCAACPPWQTSQNLGFCRLLKKAWEGIGG